MTVAEAISEAAGRMELAGLENPIWQARVLAAHLLDRSPSRLVLTGELSFSTCEEESFFSLADRVIAGEPIQHAIGSWDFYGRTFLVSPCTLIPRPETELLVETVLRHQLPSEPLILDAGTGTGVIGITLALEISGALVLATDVSPDAVRLAAGNAVRLGAINFLPVVCSLGDAIGCSFDVVTANLPYIPSSEIGSLPALVRDHEPRLALDGGESGIALILELIDGASRLLRPGGLIALETGHDQERSVTELFGEDLWHSVTAWKDLAGHHRLITAFRRQLVIGD